MTASIVFTLPDEAYEFTAATQGKELRSAVLEFDSWLRSSIKHDSQPPSAETVRATFHKYLADHDTSIN